MEIRPYRIPRSVIRDIPPPVIQNTPPPVVSELERPVVDVPSVVIDYPTIDVPTREQFEGMMQPPPPPVAPDTPQADRDLPPPTGPSIEVGGVTIDLPEADVVATTGATAVIATTTSLVAALLVKKLLGLITDLLKKKFKVKMKKIKPVLHYVPNSSGKVDILEYSNKGITVVDSVDNVEQYIRDQVELDAFYEVTNKVILDTGVKEKFTKEGQKRFKSLFLPPAKLAKKISARFSF